MSGTARRPATRSKRDRSREGWSREALDMFKLDAPVPGTLVKLGVGLLLRDRRGRILLERRSDCGLWGFPGGRVEPGESVTEAAEREVREETGLRIRVTRLVGVYSEPRCRILVYADNGDVRHLVDLLLEARVIGGRLRRSSESTELRYFAPRDLPKDLVPPAVEPLRDAVRRRYGVIG